MIQDVQSQIKPLVSPKAMKNIMEASQIMQMLDLNENYNIVAKTNSRPISKVIKSSSTVENGLVKQNTQPHKKTKGHELSRDKSEIMVDLAPQVKVQAQTLADQTDMQTMQNSDLNTV